MKLLTFIVTLFYVMLSAHLQAQSDEAALVSPEKPFIKLDDETPVCRKPNYVHPYNITHNSIAFSWLPLKDVKEYIVYYKAESWQASFDKTINGTFCRLNNLLPNTRYEFQLQAVCGELFSEPYNFQINTSPVPQCEAPNQVEAAIIGHQSAVLNWNPVPGVAKYKVSYRSETENKFHKVETKTNALELKNLMPNTLYEAKIQSVSGQNKESASSAFLTFRTLPEYLLSLFITPTDLFIQDLGNGYVQLNWTTIENASRFIIHLSNDGGKTFQPYTSVFTPTVTLPADDLIHYQAKVQAYSADASVSVYSEPLAYGSTVKAKEGKNESEIVSEVIKNKTLTIYPNPAKDVVYMKIEENYTGIFEIVIADINGEQIFETIVSGRFGEAYFHLPNISKGVYQLRVRTKNDLYKTKLMVD